VNAFAIGLKESSAVVGVTQGFAERLTVDDQRAAFANLMARLRSGDTVWATAVSAVMGPIWAARTLQLRGQEKREEEPTPVFWSGSTSYTGVEGRDAGIVGGFILGFFAVVLTEVMMAGHERAAMAAAEKADAEGMLLLKDPAMMLTGLQRTLEANNTVPGAGGGVFDALLLLGRIRVRARGRPGDGAPRPSARGAGGRGADAPGVLDPGLGDALDSAASRPYI
jgi:hypothetical protein